MFPELGRAQWAQRLGHSSVMEMVTWSGVRLPSRPRTRLSANREKARLGMGGIQVDRQSFSESARAGSCPSNICRADLIEGQMSQRAADIDLHPPAFHAGPGLEQGAL